MKTCSLCTKSLPYTEFHRDCKLADGYKGRCKVCRKTSAAVYYDKTKEQQAVSNKRYRNANKEKEAARHKLYNNANKATIAVKVASWQKANRSKLTAIEAKRRAAKLQAIPPWQTVEDRLKIKMLYLIAAKVQLHTGVKMHVDHVIPLQGKNVCGFHCPSNLQVIPALENMQKGNKLLWDY